MSEKRELSRAEFVRQRRAKQAVRELHQTSIRAVKPATMVVARVAPKQKPVEKARRYNSALGAPDIHWHKSQVSMPRVRTGWRWASFFISIMLGSALYFAWTLPYFHITGASVFGNQRLSREEISAVLGIANQSIFLVQPEDVALRLRMNYPELAAAQVDVYLPNYVYVTVAERQPVILWQQGEGYTWIDAAGVAFRPRGQTGGLIHVIGLATPPSGVAPLNDSLAPAPFIQKELVDAVLALAPNVPVDSTLTFDPKEGLGWKDNRGWEVYFGLSAQDMPLKVRVYQSLVDSLIGRGIMPEFISVGYPDAPFYRMAQINHQDTIDYSQQVVETEQTIVDSGQ